MGKKMITDTGKRTVDLGDLIPAALDATSADWPTMKINGISIDSRKTKPGDLFIAVTGLARDGHQFISQAAAAGARAAVVEHITPVPILQVRVNNSRRSIAEISHRFYDNPAQRMKLFGVTGTNGKTTVVAAVESIAQAAGQTIGVMGTVGHRAGEEKVAAANTTPEALDSDFLFSRMLAAGIDTCVMEVSSHALALDRVLGLPFTGAVFTNLTRDHLDFHADIDDYCQTKLRLFREYLQPGGWAIVNVDDPAAPSFIEASRETTLWRYSLSDKEADIRWKVLDEGFNGSTAAVFTPIGLLNIKTPLWGSFNFANLAAAIGVAIALGYPPEAIAQGLSEFTGVRGRVQPVAGDFGFHVFIDYAHTPDALRRVFTAARPLVKGRLRVLFGCGGDRDRGKRPQMARAVEEFATKIYLTSDNPRSEDPVKIITDVLEGFADPDAVIVEPDRAKAIERIILDCQPTDGAFLCGKGHENYQIIGEDTIEFDDRSLAEKTLIERGFAVFPADVPARR